MHELRRRRPAGMGLFALLCYSTMLPAAGPLPFETTPAVAEVVAAERLWDGTVEAVNRSTVSAQTSGRIAEINYDVDDYVEAGAVIIRFTNTEQRAAATQAEANLKEAIALALEAESEYNRIANLFSSGAMPQRNLDRARAALDSARARVNSARSAVESAQQQLEYTLIRAPYAGIVSERHVEVGESVTVGQPLMTGLSLEELRVTADLPAQAARTAREFGQAVILVDDERVPAESLTFFPYADPITNTFRVRVDLPAGRYGLYPGMFVKVAFVVGERRRLLIPVSALVQRSEVTGVYVVDPDTESVRLRQIRAGRQFDDRVEVLAGLAEGELVAGDPVRAGIYIKSGK